MNTIMVLFLFGLMILVGLKTLELVMGLIHFTCYLVLGKKFNWDWYNII